MRPTSKGFTAVELIITVAIVTTLTAIGAYVLAKALPGIRVKAAARELFGNLQRARITAMSNNAAINVTLTASPSSYTIGSDTVVLGAVQQGAQFGAVAGTNPWDSGRGLDDGIAIPADGILPVDQFSIDRRGRPSKDGEIYLIHAKDLAAGRRDRTYCIAVRQIGTYRVLQYNGTGWQ